MTVATTARTYAAGATPGWYAAVAKEVATKLGVEPTVGLSSEQAAQLLAEDGPNALPAETTVPGWWRFVRQFGSYMQIILLAAAVVSLAIKEWSTGVLLLAITGVNATVALRQEGKAESAMNALKAMVKASARVRRDGAEAEIPAEEVVIGDVVLLGAGDKVPADGRIVRRRPSSESIMPPSLKLITGLVGLYMAIVLDALIYFGKAHYGSAAVGSSIGLTAFALMLVVAAYESRSLTLSVLISETFDNARMNWIAVAEIALAVMVTQMDLFNRLLDTVPLKAGQFGLALASAVLLLALWELGKLNARR